MVVVGRTKGGEVRSSYVGSRSRILLDLGFSLNLELTLSQKSRKDGEGLIRDFRAREDHLGIRVFRVPTTSLLYLFSCVIHPAFPEPCWVCWLLSS